jgi:hypothetical protein
MACGTLRKNADKAADASRRDGNQAFAGFVIDRQDDNANNAYKRNANQAPHGDMVNLHRQRLRLQIRVKVGVNYFGFFSIHGIFSEKKKGQLDCPF